MTMYGVLASGMVILTADGKGKEIQENPPLEPPEGYIANYQWVETEEQIVQSWYLEPIEGTEQEAALQLTKLQALSLPDDALYEFRALAPEWNVGESYYGPGNPAIQQSRVKFQGHLFKCLTGHVSQADWTPTAAPSLWAEILPGQEGNEPEEGYGEWVQPDSTNGYSTGDKVLHDGHLWESSSDNNVWEPGAVGAPWNDLGEYAEGK